MSDEASPPGPSSSDSAEREVVIRVRGLKVGFGDHLVMDGLDLDLYRGEELKPERDGDNAVLSFPVEGRGYGAILATSGAPDSEAVE